MLDPLPTHVLLVEDHPGDARLVREHLADASTLKAFRSRSPRR